MSFSEHIFCRFFLNCFKNIDLDGVDKFLKQNGGHETDDADDEVTVYRGYTPPREYWHCVEWRSFHLVNFFRVLYVTDEFVNLLDI